MEIYKPSVEFDFNIFSLDTPHPIQGGSFFTRIKNNKGNPLFIQLPKCSTKQGIIKTNRGVYCDIMYNKNNSDSLIEWLLALEKHCQIKINEKKDIWFTSDISEDDIETMMTPIYRLYKSGKNLLIRTFVDVNKSDNVEKCMVYGEDETILSIDNIDNNVNVIPLIKIEGIKFTSKSFDIDIKLVQVMILNKEPELMQTCMIRKDGEINEFSKKDSNIPNTSRDYINNNSVSQIIGHNIESDTDKITQGDSNVSEASLSEASLSEASLSEASLSEASVNEASVSEAGVSEASVSEASVSEASVSEASVSEASVNEASVSEASVSEASVNEASVNEASVSEASVNEASVNEASVSEAIVNEAIVNETSVNEANVNEAIVNETSVNETSVNEANVNEASASDFTGYINTIKEVCNTNNILDYENTDNSENMKHLEEININPDDSEFISIRNSKEIYEEIYKAARNKAKKMRAATLQAFLEAKRIKSEYLLDDIEDSESEDSSDEELNNF